MQYYFLAVTFVLLIQSIGAQITITITTEQPVKVPETDATNGKVAFNFTVSANPPPTCNFEYGVDLPGFKVEGSGGQGGTDGQGTVKFNKDFDYEVDPSLTDVKLTAKQPCVSDEASLIVNLFLEDDNDNTPYFESNLSIITKPENVADISPIATFKARDEDVTDLYSTNSILFTLQNDYGGLIKLGNIENVDEWATVELLLNRPLDYEQASCYLVNIIATDCNGNADPSCPSPNSASAMVSIGVLDAPDELPIFTGSTPDVEISEDSPIGTIVTTVTAVDGDRGLNNPISYSLQDDSGWYEIDNNGAITVKVSQDREDGKYNTEAGTELIITATETDDIESTASITITVRLTDINDMKPTFQYQSYTASVPETASIGYPVTLDKGLIQITDSDEIENAAYYVSIKEADVPFRLSATVGVGTYLFAIIVNDHLDYAAQNEYTLTIEATDKLNSGLTSSSIVNITVSEIADKPPTMVLETTSSKCLSVPEMAAEGTPVCQFTVNYSDGSNNAHIKYSLSESSANGLNINETTGAVTIADGTIFDYESSKSYFVMVKATDNIYSIGNPVTFSLSGTITDINDNYPTFLPSSEGVIFNGDNEFASPLIVQAVDSDTGNNGVVSYKLTGHVNNAYFQIKTQTMYGQQVGIISPKDAIKLTSISACNNQQDMCTLELEVEASDSGTPTKTSSQIVIAKIMNCYCFKSSAAHNIPMELYYFTAFYVLRMFV